jgi:YidC/Oxa1 family membrane protein insertase
MDFFAFPPLAAALDGIASFVSAISDLLAPVAGSFSAALAIVILTLLVRVLLVPVGISQARAEAGRRRLAPELRALRRRYVQRPELLQKKALELYRREGISPFAGILPALAQAPVVSLVYALFIHGTIGGHANVLLAATLGGVPLGASFAATGITWPGIIVFAALLVLLALTAWLSRRATLRAAEPIEGAGQRVGRVLSWLPFATVIIAALVPLAAAIYLATTTTWSLAERAILRRRFAAS